MTIDEFLDKLSETPRDWYIRRGLIRRRGDDQCPITALCDKDVTLSREPYTECGHQLGLSDKDLKEIIKAADSTRLLPYDHDLRMRLLKACGLEELTT